VLAVVQRIKGKKVKDFKGYKEVKETGLQIRDWWD
jgi:hypothetical protein